MILLLLLSLVNLSLLQCETCEKKTPLIYYPMTNITGDECKADKSDWIIGLESTNYTADPDFDGGDCNYGGEIGLTVRAETTTVASDKLLNVTEDYTIGFWYKSALSNLCIDSSKKEVDAFIKVGAWKFRIVFITQSESSCLNNNTLVDGENYIEIRKSIYYLDTGIHEHITRSNVSFVTGCSDIDIDHFVPIVITSSVDNEATYIYFDGKVIALEEYYDVNETDITIYSDSDPNVVLRRKIEVSTTIAKIVARKLSVWNRVLTAEEIFYFVQNSTEEVESAPFMCFGLVCDDEAEACSGRGCCESLDTCVCDSGWTGTSCSVPPGTIPVAWRNWGIVSIPVIGVLGGIIGVIIVMYFMSSGPAAIQSTTLAKYSRMKEF